MKKKGKEEKGAKGSRVKVDARTIAKTTPRATKAVNPVKQKVGKKTSSQAITASTNKTAKKARATSKVAKSETVKKARAASKTVKTKRKLNKKPEPKTQGKGKVVKATTKSKVTAKASAGKTKTGNTQKRNELSIIARRIQESKRIKPSKRFSEPLVYVCKRCKQSVQLYIPAKVTCSRCGKPMQTPEADAALPELANAA